MSQLYPRNRQKVLVRLLRVANKAQLGFATDVEDLSDVYRRALQQLPVDISSPLDARILREAYTAYLEENNQATRRGKRAGRRHVRS